MENFEYVIIPDAVLRSDIGHLKAGTLMEINSVKLFVNGADFHCDCTYYQNNDIRTAPKYVQVHCTEIRVQNMNRLRFLMKKLHAK